VTTTKLTPKQLLDRMRKLKAALLNCDLNDMTPAQSVRLDRAAALRLELDDIQGRQLAGLPVDMAKFVVASEALERMLGGNPEQPTNSPDFSGAREELNRFLVERAQRIAARELKESERLREQITRLLKENACLAARLKAQSAEPHPQQENNVVPLAAKRADDRAWRDYVYGGRGTIVAWSPPGDRWEAT
jgi:hypothetical protein